MTDERTSKREDSLRAGAATAREFLRVFGGVNAVAFAVATSLIARRSEVSTPELLAGLLVAEIGVLLCSVFAFWVAYGRRPQAHRLAALVRAPYAIGALVVVLTLFVVPLIVVDKAGSDSTSSADESAIGRSYQAGSERARTLRGALHNASVAARDALHELSTLTGSPLVTCAADASKMYAYLAVLDSAENELDQLEDELLRSYVSGDMQGLERLVNRLIDLETETETLTPPPQQMACSFGRSLYDFDYGAVADP